MITPGLSGRRPTRGPPASPPRSTIAPMTEPTGETAPLEQPDVPPSGGRAGISRLWVIGMVAGAVILLGVGGFMGYLAVENHDRADRWRDRSVVLQDLVADRTRALNRQTARLNVASTRLRHARRAIGESEQDVAQLEARQRELANEKAQVEDERVALLSTAGQLDSCNDGMSSLIEIISGGFQPDPVELNDLVAVCNAADDAVNSYVQTYGSP